MSFITAISTALPNYCHSQDAITNFYINITEDDTIKRKVKTVASKSGIQTRYSVIEDYQKTAEEFGLFEKSENEFFKVSLSKRMAIFKKEALLLSLKAVRQIENFEAIKNSITHIITVTCTGLFAPGLDIELIRELNLTANIHRSSINFMGCNAAILALKNADNICRSYQNAKVLILCTELCTIHFQNKFTDDYILSNSLFADGSAAVLVAAQKPISSSKNEIEIKSFNSLIIHHGFDDMAWQLSETGFIMNLSSYVSELINGNMKAFLSSLNMDTNSINYYAIHPGGKKILDDFCAAIGIHQSLLQSSYEVLKQFGNMSSPTVLFVLKNLIENTVSTKNESIFCAAFGPGLSIETMQLQYV